MGILNSKLKYAKKAYKARNRRFKKNFEIKFPTLQEMKIAKKFRLSNLNSFTTGLSSVHFYNFQHIIFRFYEFHRIRK